MERLRERHTEEHKHRGKSNHVTKFFINKTYFSLLQSSPFIEKSGRRAALGERTIHRLRLSVLRILPLRLTWFSRGGMTWKHLKEYITYVVIQCSFTVIMAVLE